MLEEIGKLVLQNGVVAALLVYVIWWLLNKNSRQFERAEAKLERQHKENLHADFITASNLLALQQQLLLHDLTTSGVNMDPAAREAAAFRKYQENLTVMVAVKEKVDKAAEAILLSISQKEKRPRDEGSTV